MKVRALVLGLAIALLWALPAFAQGNPNGKLSGRVTSGNEPLRGVKVDREPRPTCRGPSRR